MDGSKVQRKGRSFGTLSAPGFRKYLIQQMIEQARLGVKEIHLGESNGEIHFDDWTLGLKGDSGFVQWLLQKYHGRPQIWWEAQFGGLGRDISKGWLIINIQM